MHHPAVPAFVAIALAGLCGAAQAQAAYTTRLVNLRAGPDRAYPVVTVLAAAQTVSVQGCLGDYRWCDVVAGPNRGWVYAGNLSYFYQNAYVPLMTYGPTIGVGIVAFAVDDYWDSHYRYRPWYPDRYRYRWSAPPHRVRPAPLPHPGGPPSHAVPGHRPQPAAPWQPGPPRAAQPHGARPPGAVPRPPMPAPPGTMPGRQQPSQPSQPGQRQPPGGQRHYP